MSFSRHDDRLETHYTRERDGGGKSPSGGEGPHGDVGPGFSSQVIIVPLCLTPFISLLQPWFWHRTTWNKNWIVFAAL